LLVRVIISVVAKIAVVANYEVAKSAFAIPHGPRPAPDTGH
jgi:hypothetical protein